jgi:chromosome segregation ATPase
VVDKEIYFKKDNKDPELAGKLREVIKQVSHSKKWPKLKQLDKNGGVVRNAKGKAVLVNSYSFLQDRYHDHMKQAGYAGFERGERGSTAEHLTVLEFKAKQEMERAQAEAERAAAMAAEVERKQQAAAALDTAIEGKENAAARLDAQADKKKERLEKLDEAITVKGKAAATVAEIEAMGKPALLGGVNVTNDEIKTLKTLAKKSVTADKKVADMRGRLAAAEAERDTAKAELAKLQPPKQSIREHLPWFEKFTAAMRRAPQRLMAAIDEILRQPPEKQEPQRATPERKRDGNLEI